MLLLNKKSNTEENIRKFFCYYWSYGRIRDIKVGWFIEKSFFQGWLCIEQEKPQYQFSGLGFIADDKEAFEALFAHCQNKIKEMIQNDPLYTKENLSDDEREAAEFFQLL